MSVDVIRDHTGLNELLGSWDELLAESTSQTPFLKAAWIDSWRRHAMGNRTPHVVAVREGGRLIAVAPLMRVGRTLSFADRLEFMGTGPAGADYLDVIVHRDAGTAPVNAIAEALHTEKLPLYLDHLPAASSAEHLSNTLSESGWASLGSSPDVCPFIDLTGHTWATFIDSLGSSHRANVRRRMRALESSFTTDFSLVDTQHGRREALDALVRFSQQRWQAHGGTSAFPGPALVAFHHAISRRAMNEGWLRVYALTLNGHIAAVMYGFAIGQKFFFYQHGYDPAYASYSTGIVLMARTIRAAIEEGLREFDMLYGHEAYKKLWARQHRSLSRLQLFPPRMTGTLLRRQAETRRVLRVMAQQLGLAPRHDHP